MPGLIVIEGPDGAGKTTLAEMIVNKTHGVYLHGTYTEDPYQHHLGLLKAAVTALDAGETVVMDRHWISECIYGQVMRGGVGYGTCARMFHRHLMFLGAQYVVACPPPDLVVENFLRLREERSEHVERVDHMRDIACRYLDLVGGNLTRYGEPNNYASWLATVVARGENDLQGGLITLDISRRSLADMREMVTQIARAAERRQEMRRYPRLSWGALTGNVSAFSVLLVGDRSNNDEPQPPFLGRGGSSLYLSDALQAAGILEHDICLVNANDATPELLRDLCLYTRHTVFLGKEANRAGNYACVTPNRTTVLRHPQAAARFDHHGNYHQELMGAIYG